jgi:hypothetical protein
MGDRPEIVERQIGELSWFVVSAAYPDIPTARAAWERIDGRIKHGSLGVYRHGPEDNPGTMVSAVSLKRSSIVQVRRLLSGGDHNPLDEATMDLLILRRARVVTDAAAVGKRAGHYKWRRPDGRGARLSDAGDMIEPPPGEG